MNHPARFFDGKTAAPYDVVAHFDDDAVSIHMADGDIRRWPTTDVRLGSPLEAGEPVHLTLGTSAEALIIAEPVIRDWLSAHHLSRRRSTSEQRQLMWIACGAITAIAIFVAGWATVVPSLIARVIPLSIEQSVGDNVVTQLATILSVMEGQSVTACTGAEGRAALDRLLSRLADASGSDYPLVVTVLNSPTINAMTAPGGRLVVLDGLLKYVQSPNEFAGVLAHEIGHVIHRDPSTSFIRSAGLATLIDLATGGATGGGTISVLAQLLVTSSFSRDTEQAADDAALRILTAAGIDGDGLVRFFERLASESAIDERQFRMVSSHPPSADRATRLRSTMSGAGRAAMSQTEFQALIAMCGRGG